jgi:8-oxo-dGTP pyrophosphatase MutT (NUDIX family)
VSRAALVPASYVLLWRETGDGAQVLLHLRQHTGYMDGRWASLAGHVEPGESAVEAAVREVREEVGVVLDPADLEPLTAVHRRQPGGPPVEQRVDFFFRARRWDGEPRVMEPAKNGGLRWFPVADLPDTVQPQDVLVLGHLHASGRVPAVLCPEPLAAPQPSDPGRPG